MLEKWKNTIRKLKYNIKVYQLVIKDNRTPKISKILIGLAISYALLPFDIIPDFIPVIGQIDDFIIVPALIIIATKMVPKEVLEDCKAKANSEQ